MKQILITIFISCLFLQNAKAQSPCPCDTSGRVLTHPVISGTVTISSLGFALISGQVLTFNAGSTLVIDVNTNWSAVSALMLDESRIVVMPGASFTTTACSFFGCEKLWKGIDVQSGGSIHAMQDKFQDAKMAIELRVGCSTSTIQYSEFTNNYIGIFRRQVSAVATSFPVTIQHNNFSGPVLCALKEDAVALNPNTTYDASLGILSNTIGAHSFAGIYLKYTSPITSAIQYNTFNQLHSGAVLYRCQITNFTNNKFDQIKIKYTSGLLAVRGTGIYNDGHPSNNNLLYVNTDGLPIPTEFLNCDYGIKNYNSNVEVHKANFQSTTYTCIRHQAAINLRNNIMVDSSILNQFSEYGIYAYWSGSGTSPKMKIRDNTLTMNNVVNPNKKAIYVSGPSLAGSLVMSLTGSDATIFGNTIIIPNNASYRTGIEMRWMKNGRIVRNNITLNTGASVTGINLLGLTNNKTNCNTINGVVTITTSSIGINMNQIGYSVIQCNNLGSLQKCIYINNATGPTSLYANYMYNSRQGIEMTSTAAIGPQFLNGNTWFGTSWIPSTGKISCPASLGLIFTCTSPGLWDPSGFASPSCFTTSALASINCNSTFCSELSFKTTEEPDADIESESPNLSNNVLTVFPNPASNVLTIRNSHWEQAVEYTVYSLQGSIVLKLQNPNSETQTIDISNLSKGMYILQVRSSDHIENLKFSKQ